MPEIQRGQYLSGFPTDHVVNGRKLQVTAHFAIIEGRMTCVGLDVRSFWSPVGFEPPTDRKLVFPVEDTWTEITSPLLRGVRTAEVIEEAFSTSRSAIAGVLSGVVDDLKKAGVPAEVAEQLGPQVDVLLAQEAPRPRGRKRLLSDETLRDVVAQAYLGAPRKPVQAVREALAAAVPAYKGVVSADVARKAVATARARGFIPPADRGYQRQEGQA